VSGRGGSGSFVWQRPHRWVGMPSGKDGHHPGWKPLQGSANDRIPGWAPSPCRLPGPVTRYGRCGIRRGFSPAVYRLPRLKHPLPSARKYVRGEVCGRVLGASSWGLILSSWFLCVPSSWVCIVLSWRAVLSSWNLTLVLMRAGRSMHAGQGVQGNTRGQILILSPLVTFSPTSPLGQQP
jgi:hypothetical protein